MARKQILSQPSCIICAGKPKFKLPNVQENTCEIHSFPHKEESQYLKTTTKVHCSLEKERWPSKSKIMNEYCKSTEITCFNNCKYYRRPIVPFLMSKVQNVDIFARFNNDALNNVVTNAQKQCYRFSFKSEPYRNVGTQTDYRDSESQTIPWEPPYIIKPEHNPEELSIAHLKWNHGLPAGVHEIEIINRMRMKKAWKSVLPPMDTPANIKMQTAIIAALEMNEWASREKEIQVIMDYRLELMDELTKSREAEKEEKLQARFSRLKDFLSERRNKEIQSIRHNLRGELRKLYKKQKQKQQYVKPDIIDNHINPSSELYAPQKYLGEHPQRRHEVIRNELLKGPFIKNLAKTNTLTCYLPTSEELKAIKPKPKPFDLCIRETRWTEKTLKQLHSDLKAIRLKIEPIDTSTLLKRKYKPPSLPSTPYRIDTENTRNIQIDQFSTLIQKLVKGRSIQCMMFEGRNRCRELIEELQSSHGLEENSNKQLHTGKMHMLDLQRLQNEKSVQEDRLCEILNSLEGMTVSGMLDFLSKELIRLKDERRMHAFALLAERERAMREAAEAGRRQLEYNRRREFDEMFRQMVKIHQESVETYLEDIIKDNIEWVSNEAAKEYILELCDKVDSISQYAQEIEQRLSEEEMVANMIYNFVLPEVEKNNMRNKIKEKQQNYLRSAHAAIYNEILDIPFTEDANRTAGRSKELNKITICSNVDQELAAPRTIALKIVKSILNNVIESII